MNILNKLTIKHLSKNKRRTIVSIVGIILSTALMVGIGLLSSSLVKTSYNEAIRNNGTFHTAFLHLSEENHNELKQIDHIEEINYINYQGYAPISEGQYMQIAGLSHDYLDKVKLSHGRYPENSTELIVPESYFKGKGQEIELGKKLDLSVGSIYAEDVNEYYFEDLYFIDKNEDFKVEAETSYKIVGTFTNLETELDNKFITANYLRAFSLADNSEKVISAYVTFDDPREAEKYTQEIGEKLDVEYFFNTIYLAYYGSAIPGTGNFVSSLSSIMTLMLFILSIGCTIVIYNSFAISTLEREKQFGLYASIGTTSKQIRKSVYFEAFIVGLIGIFLGVASGFLGIYITIKVLNNLLAEQLNMVIEFYPILTYILIPIIFMVIVIFVSAYLPARKAAQISPIDAIRSSKEIKLPAKEKKRTMKNIYANLGYNNMQRNKSKYRITILSFVVSLILFISFSTLTTFTEVGTSLTERSDADLEISISNEQEQNLDLVLAILDKHGIDQQSIQKSHYDAVKLESFDSLNPSYQKTYQPEKDYINVEYVIYSDQEYSDITNSAGLNSNLPTVVNKFISEEYQGKDIHFMEEPIFTDNKITFSPSEYSEIRSSFEDLNIIDNPPFGIKGKLRWQGGRIIILMSEDLAKRNQISLDRLQLKIYADSAAYQEIYQEIADNESDNIFVYSEKIERVEVMNILLAIKILVYGFISLVTLIGITSIFNTLYTNIMLRKKEFAVLKSIGMDSNGLKKMLTYEMLVIVLKSIIFSLPLSLAIIAYINISFSTSVTLDRWLIPYRAMIISFVTLALIVFIGVKYSLSLIKDDNILATMRQENL